MIGGKNNYESKMYNPTTLGDSLNKYIRAECAMKIKTCGIMKYVFNKNKFKDYILKNKFNLEIPNEEDDQDDDCEDDVEAMIRQITVYRDKIKTLQDKVINTCNNKLGVCANPKYDVFMQGVDVVEQSIPQLKDLDTRIKNNINNMNTKPKTKLDENVCKLSTFFD